MKKLLYLTFILTLAALIQTGGADAAEKLTVGNTGNSIKPAMVVLAHQMGYYKDEGWCRSVRS